MNLKFNTRVKKRLKTRIKSRKNNKRRNILRIKVGGETALNKYNTEPMINYFFNYDQSHKWKLPETPLPPNIYEYNGFKHHPDDITYPLYFSNLPKQLDYRLYVPIFKYISMVGAAIPLSPPPDVLVIYHYILDRLFKESWELCLTKVQHCPFSTIDRGNRECCGFAAPALGIVLHYVNDMFKTEQLVDTAKAVQMGLNFFARYGSYSMTSPDSWATNCKRWSYNLAEGVNIVTLYGRERRKNVIYGQRNIPELCATYHHFIVFVKDEFSIIIDSWSSGVYGVRGEWARIMLSKDINSILHKISTTDSLETTDQLLNQYFIVPHDVKILNNIDANLQKELLAVGADNLDSDAWRPKLRELFKIPEDQFYVGYGGRKYKK